MSYYFHEDIEKENGSESIRTEQQSRGCLFVLRLTELFAMLTVFYGRKYPSIVQVCPLSMISLDNANVYTLL